MSRDITFKLNKFADVTSSEFKSKVLMKPTKSPQFAPVAEFSSPPLGIPDSLDWRDEGVVSSVKDQGSVGSCWAFSTVGNIEGQWAKSGKPLLSLSAELLVDCDSNIDPNK